MIKNTDKEQKIKNLFSIKKLTPVSNRQINNIVQDFLDLNDWTKFRENGVAIIKLKMYVQEIKEAEYDEFGNCISDTEYHNISDDEFYNMLSLVEVVKLKEILSGCYIGILVKSSPHRWDLYLLYTYRLAVTQAIEALRNATSLSKTVVGRSFKMDKIDVSYTRTFLMHTTRAEYSESEIINKSTFLREYFCRAADCALIDGKVGHNKMIFCHLDKELFFNALVAEGLAKIE